MAKDVYKGGRFDRVEGLNPQVLSGMDQLISPRFEHNHIKRGWAMAIGYVPDAKLRFHRKNAAWEARIPHAIYVYPPGTELWGDIRHCRSKRIRGVYTFIHAEGIASLEGLVANPHRYAIIHDPANVIEAHILSIATIGMAQGTSGIWQAQIELCGIMKALDRLEHRDAQHWDLPESDKGKEMGFAKSVDKILLSKLDLKLSLDEIAKTCHVSPSSLSHRYQALTGRSVMDQRLRYRLNAAREGIMQGQTLSEVAEATGFCNAFHLSREFKKLNGLSPRDYVKHHSSLI